MATLTSRLIVSLKDNVSGPAKGIGATLMRLRRQGDRASTSIIGGGRNMIGGTVRSLLAVGAGYYGVTKALSGTVGASIKFEEAFADVKKVVDGTPAQLSAVRAEILDMSKRLPVTAEGLASIYAAAGQSGVALNELGKFSEMAAKVSVAWDTAQAETGDALAKIKTQLQMNVSELGLHADAINHLANNTASAANDLVDFDKRVAAVGKMYGFTDTQTLAFGASMISAGAQSEVAATSFRNMGKALTIGERATKKQREAFTKLGLDAVKTAKGMQKNALATTLDVLDRIQKLPDWQRNSIASALFGDEARGLLPVIGDSRELRRELEMVGDAANYAGSSTKEYLTRADTTANSLQLLGNRIRAIGIGIGDGWGPSIKQAADGIGDVLVSLKQRVGILDEIRASFEGFMGGLGGVAKDGEAGGIRKLMNDLGDAVFGEAFTGGSKQVDERVTALARLSNRMRGIGADFRQFFTDISSGDISGAMKSLGSALSEMSGSMTVGGAISIGLVGAALIKLGEGALALTLSKAGKIAIMATAVAALIDAAKDANSLGEFIDHLKDLSTIEWVSIAAGVALLIAPTARLAGAATRLARSLGLIKKAGGVKALTEGAEVAGKAAAKGKPRVPVEPPAPKAAVATPKSTVPEWVTKGRASNAPTILDELKNLFRPGNAGRVASGVAKGGAATVAAVAGEGVINDLFRLFGAQPKELPSIGENIRVILGGEQRDESKAPDASSFVGFFKSLWGMLPTDLTKPIGEKPSGPSDVNVIGIPEVTIPAPVTTTPSGTQDVRVTNPMPAPVINVTVNAQTNADPHAIAAATEAAISSRLNALSRGSYSDGAD